MHIFWHGYETGDAKQGQGGVGIALSRRAADLLEGGAPKYINPRIMIANLQCRVSFVSVYAPTHRASDEEKSEFYDTLWRVTHDPEYRPRGYMPVVAGDFNARIGANCDVWEKVVGRYNNVEENENGFRLLQFCAQNSLCATNTLFPKPQSCPGGTWRHPRSARWHTIDFILVPQQSRWQVSNARVFRSVDCWSDHLYVGASIRVGLPPRRRKQTKRNRRRRANAVAFVDPARAWEYRKAIHDNLEKSSPPVQTAASTAHDYIEHLWRRVRDSLIQAVQDTIGFSPRAANPDWWTENEAKLQPLLDQKKRTRLAWYVAEQKRQPNAELLKKEYHKARNKACNACHKTQNEWWTRKGAELAEADQRRDYLVLFGFWKKLNVSPGARAAFGCIRDKHGNILTDPDAQLDRWREYFEAVLNLMSEVDHEALKTVKQREVDFELATPPTRGEVIEAIHRLANRKAAGKDEITAEMLKGGLPNPKEIERAYQRLESGEATDRDRMTAEMHSRGDDGLLSALHFLITEIWRCEQVPQDWRDAVIIPLPKKGDRQLCSNWRGISLLSVAGKAFVKIIERRLSKFAEKRLSESQAGFRSKRGCIDMVFVARQLAEKSRENHQRLLACFVDLTKAYDTVNRGALWGLLGKYGVPEKVVNLLRTLYTGMKASVEVQGRRSPEFEITNGLRQGCVVSCVLFNLFFDQVVAEALEGYEGDVTLTWRKDRPLINTKKGRPTANTPTVTISELRFADDLMAVARTPKQLQDLIDRLVGATKRWGLTVSISKTNVMDQPPPEEQHRRVRQTTPSQLVIDGQHLDNVPSFVYLGSTLSNDANLDAEISCRIGKACKVWNGLRGPVFHSKGLRTATKLTVFKGAVLPALLYGAETWPVKEEHVRRLQSFLLQCLRQITKQPRHCRKPGYILLKETKFLPMEIQLRKARLRWLGHVRRMGDERIPLWALYGELTYGSRTAGGQLQRWKQCATQDLRAAGISERTWPALAADRTRWRARVDEGLKKNTEAWFFAKEVFRVNRKRTNNFACQVCGKRLSNDRGLKSHMSQKHANGANTSRFRQRTAIATSEVVCPVRNCTRQFPRDRAASIKRHLTSGHQVSKDHQRQLIASLGNVTDGRQRQAQRRASSSGCSVTSGSRCTEPQVAPQPSQGNDGAKRKWIFTTRFEDPRCQRRRQERETPLDPKTCFSQLFAFPFDRGRGGE